MKFPKVKGLAITALSVALVSCSQMPAWSQSLPGERRLSGKGVEEAFEAQRQVLQDSSASLYEGRKPILYGAVMSADGYILTKESELYNYDEKTNAKTLKELMVIVGETRYTGFKLVARDVGWDLALIKIDAENLKPVKWAESSDLAQGTWVVANGSSSKARRRVNVGIISAKARSLGGALPIIMGVGLKKVKGGVMIEGVREKFGAQKAGLKKGDIITKFDGLEVKDRDAVLDVIRTKKPGDMVEVEFKRGDKTLKANMELKAREEAGGGKKLKSKNDRMSGETSSRRDSFPRVLQTDIGQNNRQTGGPLLNLTGEAVGLNIARATRAESFAVPSEEVLQVYAELMKTAKSAKE